jgi:hypothetical protein
MLKRGYEPRSNLVKDENVDQLEDFHNNLNRWTNYFSLLLNVLGVNDVRQIEIHTGEPIVHGSSCLEVENAIAKLKTKNRQVSDQIPYRTDSNRR